MATVRWGILSTANIGVKKVLPAMARGEYCQLTALASRDLGRARVVAAGLGIPRAYGSYEELLADPEIDAVYNPMPNHLHVPWSIKALEAGKHVLCEKPLARTAAELQPLLDAAARYPHLKVMEAFMYRLHPQWQLARKLVAEGDVGDLRTVHTAFSYMLIDPANVRNQADIGGGGLLDIGCYAVSAARFLFDAEPLRVSASVEYDPVMRVDRLASAILQFERGTGTFTISTQLSPYQRVNALGTEGRVEVEIPFNAPPDRPCIVHHQRGETIETHTLPTTDQYTVQGDLFSKAILDDTPVPTPLSDALANMKVLDAIVESARTGAWV
ncbi:MAG TPA: Gfo/Idh/MocA family oxidoreductase [Chloroflexota bacterium]